MTDATYQTNAVRLRARFENGQVMVEFLRRGHGRPEPDGFYRRVWPHDLQIPGHDIVALKALAAGLPLANFAGDPDEAEAFARLMPKRPDPGATGAPSQRATRPAEAGRRWIDHVAEAEGGT